MYTRILVPLDGSKRAEKILPYVDALAQKFDAAVWLLQVIEPIYNLIGHEGTMIDVAMDLMEKREEAANHYLSNLSIELEKKGQKVNVVIETGPVVDAINTVANREAIDLIAMASHGRAGLSRAFYGSVAAGVLHQIDRPLLLIRSENDQ